MASTTEQALGTRPEASPTRDERIDKLTKAISHPIAGASVAGAIVLGAATLFGALKTAVAAGVVYGAFRYLEKRGQAEPLS